ncbi:hypothetical protein HOLleu_39475 [Holothuria leucospilota]|uniref:Uncharacterized protein n=1 Tax=Holothuria leucospilota TaxID=206669 RepID=A0A9Q1BE46_HOLLE|nr:hypothetical protein HOLleu_39475 [Holothuria leucospilota]
MLPDVRRFKLKGVIGRFAVNRDALEQEIRKRKQQDAVCSEDVKIQLPQSLPHSPYNASYQGELLISYGTIIDETLAAELSDDLKEQVSTSFQLFAVLLPLAIGMTDEHVVLYLRHFSNSTKKITHPYSTNTSELMQVDSIEEADDGTVTIKLGDDVMVFQIQNDIKYETLAAELSDDLKEQVSTSFQLFAVLLPLVIGMTDEHVVLYLRHFSNSTKKIKHPYGTNTSELMQVDSIEESDDDVKFQLPQSLPHSSYNESYQGEVLLAYNTITDNTLTAELSDDLKEQVSTSYHTFSVLLPLVTGMTDEHFVLVLRQFSNSTKKITFPYSTNTSELIQVDSIEEADDGTVTIRLGDDVMVFQIQNDIKCKGETKVTKDFDKVSGDRLKVTNYPLLFDWGCTLLKPQVSFCELLDGFQCEIARVGGDVCTVSTTTISERSPATMKVVNMTGVFREMIPFFVETVPSESFEAELLDRQHSTGIVYPCLIP